MIWKVAEKQVETVQPLLTDDFKLPQPREKHSEDRVGLVMISIRVKVVEWGGGGMRGHHPHHRVLWLGKEVESVHAVFLVEATHKDALDI